MRVKTVLRNTAILAGLGCLLFFGPIFNTATSWFVTFFVLLLLISLLVSLCWPLRLLKLTAVKQKLFADATLGPALKLRGWGFFPNLTVQIDDQRLTRAYFGVGWSLRAKKPLSRGIHRDFSIQLLAEDWLGWTRKSRKLVLSQPLVVGPRRELAFSQTLDAAFDQFQRLQTLRSAEPGFELREFHPYSPHDSVNAIDWKASAKRQELLVRQNEPAESPVWSGVFLNQNGPNYERLLGLFNTLNTRAHFWQQGWLLAESGLLNFPTGEGLAQLRGNDDLALNELEARVSRQGLIIFTATPAEFMALRTLLPKTPLILVTCVEDRLVLEVNQQRVELAEGPQHA